MTKKKIDGLDLKILKYLNKGSRQSLKKLSTALDQKTSTIYHRLSRLQSNNIILDFSLVFNPAFLKNHKLSSIKLQIKPLNINSLDDMFIQSFANYIKNEYENILFIALSEETRTIHLISILFDEKEHEAFLDELRKNPYTEDVIVEYFSEIIKGEQLLKFKDDWVKREDDVDELEEEGGGEFEKKATMEINFDDDDENFDDEIKF